MSKILSCFMLILLVGVAFASVSRKCRRPHEVYACGSACQNECATLGEPCLIRNIRCNNACYCISGYARDAHYNCIPEKQCPPKQTREC